jgi:predicted MFS family arabinose efflux permease
MVVLVLTAIYATNLADRYAVSSLAEAIKSELNLSDTQIGFVNGLGFSLFYAILGVPFAMLADRTSRRWVLIGSVWTYSTMIAVCGLAQNFWQFAAARIGLGIGEAPTTAVSQAILARLFPRDKLNVPMAVFSVGVSIGVAYGFYAPVAIAESMGWRGALMLMGVPGIVLAGIALLILRPDRQPGEPAVRQPDQPPFLRQLWTDLVFTLRHMWKQPALRWIMLGSTLVSPAIYGVSLWIPSFLSRSHGVTALQAGEMSAVFLGMGGAIGILAGGLTTDLLGRRDPRWHTWVSAIALTASAVPAIFLFAVETGPYLYACLFVKALLSNAFTGPMYSLVQALSPRKTSALSAAVLLMLFNIVGLGLGTQIIGLLSDAFASAGQPPPGALRNALLIASLPLVLGGICYFVAAFHVERGYKAVGTV